ncbi:hypothetical protein HL736_001194 [Campylobacter lari]|uniref:hypothetical protein n=1 Tax=Campylobacter volucris TaxID=1031542 RepID=UPI0018A0C5B1|nr:hypothetical protein [Campylobacter volucris]EFO9318187.1 hypothetical protein [Campylobacter lari]MBF7048135.1 hypothetical protein [Campylobacter volucris]HED1004876.1 hypothetical protein [Campylobacter jejuni]
MSKIKIDTIEKIVFLNTDNIDDEKIKNSYKEVLNSGAYQIIKSPKRIDFHTAINENNQKYIFLRYDENQNKALNKLILAEAYMFLKLMAEKF